MQGYAKTAQIKCAERTMMFSVHWLTERNKPYNGPIRFNFNWGG